jgi:hypothetical protein
LRFAPGDIVRAIEEVGAAGLTVYGVEITLTGALNISTQPPSSVSKRPATPRQETKKVDETAKLLCFADKADANRIFRLN